MLPPEKYCFPLNCESQERHSSYFLVFEFRLCSWKVRKLLLNSLTCSSDHGLSLSLFPRAKISCLRRDLEVVHQVPIHQMLHFYATSCSRSDEFFNFVSLLGSFVSLKIGCLCARTLLTLDNWIFLFSLWTIIL